MEKNPLIALCLETSCDETAAAVLSIQMSRKKNLALPVSSTLSSVVRSQTKLHGKMGGVVPEAAARAHVRHIGPMAEKALKQAGLSPSEIDLVAVTTGPGLAPSLLVGVEFAKAFALATGKPVLAVNHMLGHLYSPFGRLSKRQFLHPGKLFPQLALIVSGGHTMLVLLSRPGKYRVLGQTRDDAAGEAFDKVAKLLGLPYPGGPQVSRLAEQGNPEAIAFPRPMVQTKNFDFSFSGLKTAVLYHYQAIKAGAGANAKLNQKTKADICASFQQAAVDVLVAKTIKAAAQFKARSVSLSGGVSANRELRRQLLAACRRQKLPLFVPSFSLCTDNAEMIGLAAAFLLQTGKRPQRPDTVAADPSLSL